MSTRKVFERKAAQHETPPPAVSGRLHVAAPSSDHLASVGGGSLPAPDNFYALARRKPLELIALLGAHSLGSLIYLLLPADVVGVEPPALQ